MIGAFKKAEAAIVSANSIAIACHVNPDGDALGSLLSLGLGLEQIGKKVYFLSQDGVPKKYRQLPGADRVTEGICKKVDLGITVDCNSAGMIGRPLQCIRRAGMILEIDHHSVRKSFGNIQLIDPKAAAVGELVHVLLKKLNVKITKEIAQNIMTSLIVETNSFRLPNVRSFTFKVCSELMRTGIDFYRLVDMVYWTHTKEAARLSGICLSRCRFSKSGTVAWSVIKRKDFIRVKGKDEDVDAVADELRAIKGVRIAIFFREKDENTLRVSFRSKEGINVGALAALYGGGGHSDIAGCKIKNKLANIKGIIAKAEKLAAGRGV